MLNLDNIIDLPHEKVNALVELIQDKRNGLLEEGLFINQIVREDIFNILDHYCTVVFFPLPEEEENDGFHITIPVDYKKDESQEHFVFLNTTKPLEKQVFAAAHELGHIWVPLDAFWDDGLKKRFPQNQDNVEDVMNRFAAELLMPRSVFQQSAGEQLKRFIKEDHRIHIIDAFRVITGLMDEFCVPAQAVICRLYEVELLSKDACKQLLTGPVGGPKSAEYQKFFESVLRQCIQEGGYTKLLKPTEKRGIKDFPEVLNDAEREGVFSKQMVDRLRSMLDIPKIEGQAETIDIGEAK